MAYKQIRRKSGFKQEILNKLKDPIACVGALTLLGATDAALYIEQATIEQIQLAGQKGNEKPERAKIAIKQPKGGPKPPEEEPNLHWFLGYQNFFLAEIKVINSFDFDYELLLKYVDTGLKKLIGKLPEYFNEINLKIREGLSFNMNYDGKQKKEKENLDMLVKADANKECYQKYIDQWSLVGETPLLFKPKDIEVIRNLNKKDLSAELNYISFKHLRWVKSYEINNRLLEVELRAQIKNFLINSSVLIPTIEYDNDKERYVLGVWGIKFK